ncbi:MAG: D-aminoacyl-tRNA deacylase [Patescibacteria group bacterium]|nr:D-aminoacyl-tRNA deacylase [Patescibacteria group bacterium]
MKILIQRVKFAKLRVGGELIGEIREGYLLYLGIEKKDKNREGKIVKNLMRIKFIDEKGKFKKSLKQESKPLMVISNITLIARWESNRPEFFEGPVFEEAKIIFSNFIHFLKNENLFVISGFFGAEMFVESENIGPINFVIEI